MKTNIALIITTLFCSFQILAQETKVDCDCPKPTQDQITRICDSAYGNKIPIGDILGSLALENLWEMSCADPLKDSMEEAKIKIQCMWNKYKEEFKCSNFSGVSTRNQNLLRFSVDVGFPYFTITLIKRYGLDINFKDPIDGKTLLDMVEMQIKSYKNAGFERKIREYQKLYGIIIEYGGKRASEL
jgi:hypothetical protein